MLVGICELEFIMYDLGSLKEKRQIVKSVIDRIKSRYNVSIAEIGSQDKWQKGEIGFCCISNDRKHTDEMINKVINFIENDGRLDISKCNVEIV